MKKCRSCSNAFTPKYKTTEVFCSLNCAKEGKKPDLKLKSFKTIPKVSKKRQVENLQYQVLRTEFLAKKENQICPITRTEATTVHHKMGRIGFADQWARDNNISLYLDTRHWVSLSMEGHKFVEENPEWSKDNGYSLNRL